MNHSGRVSLGQRIANPLEDAGDPVCQGAGQGSIGIFFSSPVATIMWILAVLILFLPLLRPMIARVRGVPAVAKSAGPSD